MDWYKWFNLDDNSKRNWKQLDEGTKIGILGNNAHNSSLKTSTYATNLHDMTAYDFFQVYLKRK
jgi:hypothetical protein